MQCASNFIGADVDIFRQAADNVAPAHGSCFLACTGISRADRNFDVLGSSFANHQVVFLFDVRFDVAVEFVARNTKTFTDNNAAQ